MYQPYHPPPAPVLPCDSLQNQIMQLQNLLAQKDDQLDQHMTRQTECRRREQELLQKLDHQKGITHKYKVSLEQLYHTHNQTLGREQANRHLAHSLEQMSTQALHHKSQINELQQYKTELENKYRLEITTKNNSHQTLTAQLQEKNYQLNDLKRKHNDLLEMKTHMEAQIRDLQFKVESTLQQNNLERQENSQHAQAIEKQQNDTIQIQAIEINALKNDNIKMQGDINNLRNQIALEQDAKQVMADRLQIKEQQIIELQTKIEQTQNRPQYDIIDRHGKDKFIEDVDQMERERQAHMDQIKRLTKEKREQDQSPDQYLLQITENEDTQQKNILEQLKRVPLKMPRSQNSSLVSAGSIGGQFKKDKETPNELLRMLAANITGVFKILNEQIYELLFAAYMRAITLQKSNNAKQIVSFYQEITQIKQNNYAGLKTAMQVYVFVRDHASFILQHYSCQMDNHPVYLELKALQGIMEQNIYRSEQEQGAIEEIYQSIQMSQQERNTDNKDLSLLFRLLTIRYNQAKQAEQDIHQDVDSFLSVKIVQAFKRLIGADFAFQYQGYACFNDFLNQ